MQADTSPSEPPRNIRGECHPKTSYILGVLHFYLQNLASFQRPPQLGRGFQTWEPQLVLGIEGPSAYLWEPSSLQTSSSEAALRVPALQLMLWQLLQAGPVHTLCHFLLHPILKIMHKPDQKIAHLERPTTHTGQCDLGGGVGLWQQVSGCMRLRALRM